MLRRLEILVTGPSGQFEFVVMEYDRDRFEEVDRESTSRRESRIVIVESVLMSHRSSLSPLPLGAEWLFPPGVFPFC